MVLLVDDDDVLDLAQAALLVAAPVPAMGGGDGWNGERDEDDGERRQQPPGDDPHLCSSLGKPTCCGSPTPVRREVLPAVRLSCRAAVGVVGREAACLGPALTRFGSAVTSRIVRGPAAPQEVHPCPSSPSPISACPCRRARARASAGSRSPSPSSAWSSPTPSPAATSSRSRPPARARRSPSACRSSTGSRPTTRAPRRSSSPPPASSRRRSSTRLRAVAHARALQVAPSTAASASPSRPARPPARTSSSPPPAGSRTFSSAASHPRARAHPRPRRGRPDARHGLPPAVDRIVAPCPRARQTLFFSATLDGEAGKLGARYTRDAARDPDRLAEQQAGPGAERYHAGQRPRRPAAERDAGVGECEHRHDHERDVGGERVLHAVQRAVRPRQHPSPDVRSRPRPARTPRPGP